MDTVAITIVCSVAAVLRATRLGTPSRLIFDESFYARDACWYIRSSVETCRVGAEINLEHPPLGKWLIAAGEAVAGYGPVGWRVASVVAGVAAVAVTYLLARKLLSSTFAATFASGLLAVDLLHFVHSRMSMLDIFLGLFVLIAFTCLAWDRDHLLEGRRGLRERPWRSAAGIAAGAAIAVKWSGVFTLAGVVATTLAWELWMRRSVARRRALLTVIKSAGPGMVVAFVLLPAVVYVAAHIGRVEGTILALPWAEGSWFETFIDRQQIAYRFHIDLEVTNPYASPPWWWLLVKRGIPYYFVNPEGVYRQVTAAGSPLVWWLSIPALVTATIAWIRNNSPVRPEGLLLSGFYWNYLPWIAFAGAGFLLGSGRTAVFIFYVVPLLPFMFVVMAGIAQKLVSRMWGKALVALFAAGAIGLFGFYYPVLTGSSLTKDQWSARMWIFDSCGRGDRAPLTVTQIRTRDQIATTRVVEKGKAYLPPTGFCWIQFTQGLTRIDLDSLLQRSR